MEAYTQGVSTRNIDDLAQALGMSGLSKSTASRMLSELDEAMRVFCQYGAVPNATASKLNQMEVGMMTRV